MVVHRDLKPEVSPSTEWLINVQMPVFFKTPLLQYCLPFPSSSIACLSKPLKRKNF